jgi:hypothetical protein
MTFRSRSLIIAMPDHVDEKNAVMITIPGVRNSRYDWLPKPGRSTTRLKSWL